MQGTTKKWIHDRFCTIGVPVTQASHGIRRNQEEPKSGLCFPSIHSASPSFREKL